MSRPPMSRLPSSNRRQNPVEQHPTGKSYVPLQTFYEADPRRRSPDCELGPWPDQYGRDWYVMWCGESEELFACHFQQDIQSTTNSSGYLLVDIALALLSRVSRRSTLPSMATTFGARSKAQLATLAEELSDGEGRRRSAEEVFRLIQPNLPKSN